MTLPDPASDRATPRLQRPVVFAAVTGGGIALLAVVVGLVIMGIEDHGDTQIASTGLATIGATLAGAFAGWMGRGRGLSDEGQRDD
jgi:hypothetical protein